MCHKSTINRAEAVKAIVEEHYEPGRQDRSKLWVYRHFIRPQFAISQRTFFYYLSLLSVRATEVSDAIQLKLF